MQLPQSRAQVVGGAGVVGDAVVADGGVGGPVGALVLPEALHSLGRFKTAVLSTHIVPSPPVTGHIMFAGVA